MYVVYTSARELSESLEKKYKTEDAGSKKFLACRFADFEMVDNRSVVSQTQEFEVLVHEMHAEGSFSSS